MNGRIPTHDEEHGAASVAQGARVMGLEDLGKIIRAKLLATAVEIERPGKIPAQLGHATE
ncbi:MAG: hypothetical protein ACRDJC_18695 [Thermomicrobiales bacterium]